MKRSSVTADVTAPFVEPTSVTVVSAPLAARTSATSLGSTATGAATTASSTSSTASRKDDAGSTAPRSPAADIAPGSTSQPRTSSTPAARAASPTEAPISPVPTTARLVTISSGTHQLGDAKREIERLARVQPQVAERHVARVELRLLHVLRSAETLGDVVTGELEMHAARPGPRLTMCRKEAFDLAENVVEVARLPSARARDHVRVHRVAHPDDGMLCFAHRAQDRRQELEHALGSHARYGRQAPWDPLRGQAVAELRHRPRRPPLAEV